MVRWWYASPSGSDTVCVTAAWAIFEELELVMLVLDSCPMGSAISPGFDRCRPNDPLLLSNLRNGSIPSQTALWRRLRAERGVAS